MHRKTLVRALVAVSLVGVVVLSAGQDRVPLLDAHAAVARIEGNDPEAKIELAESAFDAHMHSFAERNVSVAPKVAATEWLALVDEAIAIPQRSQTGMFAGFQAGPVGTLSTVLPTLPPPDSWPEIRAIVDARPPSADRTALQLLCARLLGDDEAVLRYCDEYDRLNPESNQGWVYGGPTTTIRLSALARLGKIASKRLIEDWFIATEPNQEPQPYLGDLLPASDAREVMLDYLKRPNISADFRNPRNIELAQQVVLSHLNEFTKPRWGLARSWGDLSYIRRLVDHYGFAKLFGPDGESGDTTRQIYCQWLLENGEVDKAAKLIKGGLQDFRMDANELYPPPKNLDRTILALQDRLPNVDLWDTYIDAAEVSHHVRQAIERLRTVARSSKTSTALRVKLWGRLADLHCRIGDLTAACADFDAAKKLPWSQKQSDPFYGLIAKGVAARDKRLMDRGIASEIKSGYASEMDRSDALLAQGRLRELEQFIVDTYRASSNNRPYQSRLVENLCAIYYRANRPREILVLLDKFPSWPASDVSKLEITPSLLGPEEDEHPTAGFYVAWAFSKTGRKDLALRTLRNTLIAHESPRGAYPLLNSLGDISTLPAYDELIKAHPLSPVPIVWKGDLLFRLGKTRDAEACVHQAILLNPLGPFECREELQGLQEKIERSKGDLAGAQRCDNLVKAIHLQAHADELSRAGLISMAVADLQKADTLSPEDTSGQSQLAVCLMSEDDYAASLAHSVKAIEHLPASLGENVDYGVPFPPQRESPAANAAILTALNKLVKRNPTDANSYFARGTVLLQLGRSKEAVEDLRRTVAIDPNHYSAWEKLASLPDFGPAGAERDRRSALQSIRLSPFDPPFFAPEHLDSVSDLRAAYLLIQDRLNAMPQVDSRSIFPLHAAQPDPHQANLLRFGWLNASHRSPNTFITGTAEFRSIASLHHPSRFGF